MLGFYAYTALYGWQLNYINSMKREQQITHPPFTPFRKNGAQMHALKEYRIASLAEERELNEKFLADAIPAQSFAAGRNVIKGMECGNYLEISGSMWPRKNNKWLHSDIKNVAYCYVKGVYEMIAKGK